MFGRRAPGHHPGMDTRPIFLTGATGFVGMELLARYLGRTDRTVYALVRGSDDADAQRRLDATIARVLHDPSTFAGRARAVRGDVMRPGLALPPRWRAALAEEVGEIVHAAASVSFGLPLPESRRINVRGTEHVLQFAQTVDQLRNLSYISTAYVAGEHRGVFGEDDLDVGQCFRNPYERSKFEAEQRVRAHTDLLPIQIFRPSIVVGEADTGWTPAFNVIYWPLKAFARGAYKAIPARRSAPVDVVPVSYVADAIFELSERGEPGTTYALAAGGRATSVGEVLELSAGYFGRRKPHVIPPSLYRRLAHPFLLRRADGRNRKALEASEVFFPYFAMRVRYDTANARAAGMDVPPLRDYFERLMDYAVAVDWGKAQPDRAATLATSGFSNERPYASPTFP
jgi:thioester reductase-like protein